MLIKIWSFLRVSFALLLFLVLLETLLEFFRKNVTNFADAFQPVLKRSISISLVLVCGTLDSHIADGLGRVRDRVGAKLHVLVFHDLVAEEVTESMVLIVETEGGILRVSLDLQSLVLGKLGFLLCLVHFNV